MGSPWRSALILAALFVAHPAGAESSEAHKALLRGEYERVETLLEGRQTPAAKMTRAQLWLHTGRYDDAAKLATKIARQAPGPLATRASVLAARALLRRGRAEEARKVLQPAARRGSLPALDWLARAATARGDHETAERHHRALIQAYNQDKIAPGDSRALLAVARAAWALGAFKDANATFAEAATAAPKDVEVQLEWADLFLSKYDPGQAARSLQHAMSVNPKHARTLERMGRLSLEHRLDFAEAAGFLDRALAIDPQLTGAHVTRAAIALRDHELQRAERHVRKALETNPRDLEALSMLAAIRFVGDDTAGFRKAERAVLGIDPKFSRMYSILAGHAEWEHRYPEMVELADKALRIDPTDAYAHAARGLNLLRLGRQDEGIKALHAAWSRDRYNQRVFNTLNLYEEVIEPDYVTFKHGRYRLRTHKDEHDVLEPYLGPLLAEGYTRLQSHYGIAPKGPLWFELYASPKHFSVRTTGLPRIGVQGVCFGTVVTALSPGSGEINWGQIVWHEQAHIFHIELSNNRVPRWFTEGLAEYETEIARPEWKREDDRALLHALERDTLPPIARLNHAFTHAQSPEEVMVAYYASSRVVAYLVERFGFEAIPKLLEGWGRGLDSEQVFEKVLGLSLAQLNDDFRGHTLERLKPLRSQFRVQLDDYDSPSKQREKLLRDPSPTNRAGLAAALLLRGQPSDAIAQAQKALAKSPKQPLALWVLAEAQFRTGHLPQARTTLDTLLAAGKDGYGPRMLSARIAIKDKDWARARTHLERAIALDPDQAEAYVMLGGVADATKDLALRTQATLALTRIEQHSTGPLRLALPLLADGKRWKELDTLAQGGVYLMPASSLLHRFWAEAKLGLGQPSEARPLAERAVRLAEGPEEEASALLARARALKALGKAGEARRDVKRAVKLVPALRDAAQKVLSR